MLSSPTLKGEVMYTRTAATCDGILHLKVPKKLKMQLKKAAKTLDMSASEIVRRSLAKFLNEAKDAAGNN